MAGSSNSNDGDVSGNHGNGDYWIVKLSDIGNIEWQKCLGGSDNDIANSINRTSDGGYIVSGTSVSNDGDVSGNHGNWDYWIVKINDTGAIQWQKSLGGSGDDGYIGATIAQQTIDNGYIVAGYSKSNDSEVNGNHGYQDYWVVKLSESGDIQWQKCLGGSSVDEVGSIEQTADSGYIIAGFSNSNDSDVTGNHGGSDYWIVKMFPDSFITLINVIDNATTVTICPNPVTSQLTIRSTNHPINQLTITNLLGQTLYTHEYNIQQVQVDVSTLPSGIYFIKINDTEVRKFIKQ